MRKQFLFILALLCAFAQGVWAQITNPFAYDDVWNGSTTTRPQFYSTYEGKSNVFVINTAAELVWIRNNWDEPSGVVDGKDYYQLNYYLNANLDMNWSVCWIPLGGYPGETDEFDGEFYGNGHTIRIHIWGTDDNYQGLFYGIDGKVENLHVAGKIDCNNSRLVGGICGQNYGTIRNCWVSADVSSRWTSSSSNTAKVGGIAGQNGANYEKAHIEYCCMSGNVTNNDADVGGLVGYHHGESGVLHCTFYGTRSSTHSQEDIWMGDCDGWSNYLYTYYKKEEYEAANGNDMYRYALQYPFAVNISNNGPGVISASITRDRPEQTVKLTKTSGTLSSLSVTDADGNSIALSGDETNGWTFAMPKRDVNVRAVFMLDDNSIPMTSSMTTLEDGKTYRVVENTAIGSRIDVRGTVSLILNEGTTLTAYRGFEVNDNYNANLTIDGSGTLNITYCDDHKSGIGAERVGTITINGGTINVTGGEEAAAIGGDEGNTLGGTITINGGVINATGGRYGGAGIGSGASSFTTSGVCGNITINGGQVTATGVDGAAGIGLGDGGYIITTPNSGTLTLSWSTPDDFIDCSGYKNSGNGAFNSITFNKQFVLNGTNTIVTAENINGVIKKIVPYFTLSGEGTEVSPYIIGTADEWNTFCGYVNDGCSFSGYYVRLNNDINVTTMAGASYTNSFQGTFDGGGHKLTFSKGSSGSPFDEDYCAPFRHVLNATFKNLHVDGTIYTSVQKAAGFVGESHGALHITNCRSSVNILSSRSGDGTHGGFVATLSGADNNIIIDGCLFDGSFATTNNTGNCGGFVGWPVYNTPTIKNSLMKPTSVDAGMLNNTFARWHEGYEPDIRNCYYVSTDNLPTNQGTQAYAVTNAPANLGSLVQDYGMVKAYQNGILYDGKFYVAPASISLADNSDNTTTISNAEGSMADVTLQDRTLYKDGKWNTICLPFDVVLEGSALEGAVARPLTAASISGTTLNLTFGDAVTTLTAGTPYIIKWESGNNIVSPVFYGVTIDKTDHSYDNGQSGDIRVRFLGTYKSTAFDSENKSILLMGGANTLYYPTTGAGIGAQRAYFKIGDGTALARSISGFNINFGDEDNTTGIISLTPDPSPKGEGSEYWYSLDGRRLDTKPTKKGVYINNGRRIVIK